MEPIEMCNDCIHNQICRYVDAIACAHESDFIKDYGDLPIEVTLKCKLKSKDSKKKGPDYRQCRSCSYFQIAASTTRHGNWGNAEGRCILNSEKPYDRNGYLKACEYFKDRGGN